LNAVERQCPYARTIFAPLSISYAQSDFCKQCILRSLSLYTYTHNAYLHMHSYSCVLSRYRACSFALALARSPTLPPSRSLAHQPTQRFGVEISGAGKSPILTPSTQALLQERGSSYSTYTATVSQSYFVAVSLQAHLLAHSPHSLLVKPAAFCASV